MRKALVVEPTFYFLIFKASFDQGTIRFVPLCASRFLLFQRLLKLLNHERYGLTSIVLFEKIINVYQKHIWFKLRLRLYKLLVFLVFLFLLQIFLVNSSQEQRGFIHFVHFIKSRYDPIYTAFCNISFKLWKKFKS